MTERERYSVLGSIAKGGMAQVYLGRMIASAGFSRLVAIKRLHPQLGEDREFVAALLDEARLTERIRHTNVVDILDVYVKDGAFALVLEWVEGASLSTLVKRARALNEAIPQPIVMTIMQGVLRGLVAAHEARSEDGQPLGIVHRDISPQNVLVGVDGIPRIIDFGVAKARGKLEATRPGEVQGKFPYMAPEHLMARPVTAQADVYAAGVVMWELLTGQRCFQGDDERAVCAAVMQGNIRKPSAVVHEPPSDLDDVVLKACARDLSDRYFDAREMLAALQPFEVASVEEVGMWVRALAAEDIDAHHRMIEAAKAPEARSLEALLSELTPAVSSPAISSPAISSPSISGPVSVSIEATTSSVSEMPAARGADTHWLAATAVCVSLALFGLVVAIAFSRVTPAPAAAATAAPLAPPAETTLAPTEATTSEQGATTEPLPEEPNAIEIPNASSSASPKHGKSKPRPKAPVKRDPTDHR